MYSCEEDIIQEETKITSLTEEQIDQNIRDLSQVLADALYSNKELVKEIKHEISYRFDYDNDALIQTFLGRDISGEKFEDILSNSSNGKYSSKDIKKMILESGYLHFSVPLNYESLDFESKPPLAVPVYSFIDEQDTEYLEAFDRDGNTVKLSAKEMPSVPVIIVGRSERVDEDGNLRVSERSVVISKKSRSLHYTEAIKQSRNPLKSAKINQHILTILSQEEFDKLGDGQEPLAAAEYGANLKSTNSSEIQLTGYTNKPKEMYLNWSSFSNGTYTSNRYKVWRDGVELYDQYYYTSKTDIAPQANSVYNYHVKYYYNNIYLGQTNELELHSSHRQSGGYEYISRLYASHAMVVAVEGWWVSELEINWEVYCANVDGTTNSITLETGGNTWETQARTKFVNSDEDVTIFQWNKTSLAYTIRFWEDDRGTKTKTDEVYVDLGVLAVEGLITIFFPEYAIVSKLIEKIGEPVKRLITVLRDDDPMGKITVTWWMHDNLLRNVDSPDFKVIINHKLQP